MMPLAGQRIVVTRAVGQAEELAGPLRALGATVILLPAIAIAAPSDPKPLLEAAAHCADYDWIIFSSQNAVEAFAAAIPRGVRCTPRVGAVGMATKVVAEQLGFRVAVTPDDFVAESLAEAFRAEHLAGKRVLIPSAAVTRNVIPNALRARRAEVEVVEAYRNVLPEGTAELASAVFEEPLPEWILFASSSAVENILSLASRDVLRRVAIGTIGPITSRTVIKYGLSVKAEASVHTVEGLVDAVVRSTQNQPVLQ